MNSLWKRKNYSVVPASVTVNSTEFVLPFLFSTETAYSPGIVTDVSTAPETGVSELIWTRVAGVVEAVGHSVNSHFGPVRPTYEPSGQSFASIVQATGFVDEAVG